ncbi:MAG: ABC transporter permease, partial [Candidatus Wallbacteria bacterium]|nr:ABC transporter permease [Candidatus Wallbacteria bacterium]
MRKTPGSEWHFPLLAGLILAHVLLVPILLEKVPAMDGNLHYDWATGIVLFCANAFFAYCGVVYRRRVNWFSWPVYLSGYFLLFFIVFAISGRVLLFSMVVFLYAGLFHRPWSLGYLIIFVVSVLAVSAYWITCFILGSYLLYIIRSILPQLSNRFESALLGAGFLLLFLILFPLINLLFQYQPQTLLEAVSPQMKGALSVSLATAGVSTLIILVFGVPIAWCMARKDFSAKSSIDALIDLPIIVPQTAAGIAILVLLGPKTPLGEFFSSTFGISFAGTQLGIIACQIFVSSPFLIRSAIHAFENVNAKLENTSRSLGATPAQTFFRVSLPLAAPGIFNGCILTFSRAISEAGSIMIVAYRPSAIPI